MLPQFSCCIETHWTFTARVWLHRLSKHLLKWVLTVCLCLKSLPHKPQINCLTSMCTGWWRLNSYVVQKRFGHSLQAYGFTPLCRRKWSSKLPLSLNFMLAELSDTRYRHMNRLETQLLTLIRHLAHCWRGPIGQNSSPVLPFYSTGEVCTLWMPTMGSHHHYERHVC